MKIEAKLTTGENVYLIGFVQGMWDGHSQYVRAIVMHSSGHLEDISMNDVKITDPCYVGTGRAKFNG